VLSLLPGKDCAACGAPSCAAHAEDVARGRAALDDCVFLLISRLREATAFTRETNDE